MTSRCIVIQDGSGDRHAAELDDVDKHLEAAIALAREVACEVGEVVNYWVIVGDDPGAARLMPSSFAIGPHASGTVPAWFTLPPLCGECDDAGTVKVGRRAEWCDCDAGIAAREDHAIGMAEYRAEREDRS